MTRNRTYLWSAGLLALGMTAAPAAHAQSVPNLSFTLTPPDQSGLAGDIINFNGTVANLDPNNAVFLNSDDITFSAPGLSLDDSPFFNNVPGLLDKKGSTDSMGNPTDSYTGDFFDVTIANDGSALPGTYFGIFKITDGVNPTPLATQDFSVTVSSPQPVPEASTTVSFGLLALGLVGVVIARRRRSAA